MATLLAIASCYNEHNTDGWNENIITNRVLGALEKLGLELNWTDKAQKVKWEGYKLRGKAETLYGDIALIVKIQLTENTFIEGVAFYEAKRQYFQNKETPTGFKSIKRGQLSTIGKSTHAANILLYDVHSSTGKGFASSVPIEFITSLLAQGGSLAFDRTLHKYGHLWIRSIANNFIGLNLDYRDTAVSNIKKSVKSLRRPAFVLNVAIAMAELSEPQLDSSFMTSTDYDHFIKSETYQPSHDKNLNDDGPGF